MRLDRPTFIDLAVPSTSRRHSPLPPSLVYWVSACIFNFRRKHFSFLIKSFAACTTFSPRLPFPSFSGGAPFMHRSGSPVNAAAVNRTNPSLCESFAGGGAMHKSQPNQHADFGGNFFPLLTFYSMVSGDTRDRPPPLWVCPFFLMLFQIPWGPTSFFPVCGAPPHELKSCPTAAYAPYLLLCGPFTLSSRRRTLSSCASFCS